MELDFETFKKIELLGWAVAFFITFFAFFHFFVFLAIAMVVRGTYMTFKKTKLGPLPVEGKSVLITGCDSGFGLALAKRLHAKGFKIFATCLNLKSDGATCLQSLDSDRMRVVHLNVANDSMVAKCLQTVRAECDNTGLWGLVNNAGRDFLGDAELATVDQYLEVANVNLFGMVRMSKSFLPLIRQAKGRILNVTSVKGLIAVPYTAPYTMAKFGGEAFSDILRQETSAFDVKVIVIEPGNFGGITGMMNDSGMTRMSSEMDAIWREASPEAKDFFGQVHLQKLQEAAKQGRDTTHPTVEPVIDAMEDALCNMCPHFRYLISGSNSYLDIYTTLARLEPFLPQTIFEKLRAYFFPYIIYK